jgi:hypothetical protein
MVPIRYNFISGIFYRLEKWSQLFRDKSASSQVFKNRKMLRITWRVQGGMDTVLFYTHDH